MLANAGALAHELLRLGAALITGGTQNHLMVIDVMTTYGMTGMEARDCKRPVSSATSKSFPTTRCLPCVPAVLDSVRR